MSGMYCDRCDGLGELDHDTICRRCHGTGIDPDFEPESLTRLQLALMITAATLGIAAVWYLITLR